MPPGSPWGRVQLATGGLAADRTAGAAQVTGVPLTEKVRVPVGKTAAPEDGVTGAVRVTAWPVTGVVGAALIWVLVAKETTCQVYAVVPRSEL